MTEIIVTPIPFSRQHHDSLKQRLIAIESSATFLLIDRRSDTVTINTEIAVSAGIQTALVDAVDAHNASAMSTDKTTITADDTDTATITMTDAAIGASETVDYAVYGSDDEIDFSGIVVSGASGSVQYAFKTAVVDTYTIVLSRQDANELGMITITTTGA